MFVKLIKLISIAVLIEYTNIYLNLNIIKFCLHEAIISLNIYVFII